MAAFRILGQFVQYLLDDGQVNAGGSVTFYETDLTTLKNTYTDPTLTVPNSNPVDLTADGRLSSDVWGSGEYGAELRDSDGVILETLNNIQSGADPGFEIPALIAGGVLVTNGSILEWDTDLISLLLPDMTGEAGNILYTDGTIPYWDSPPADPVIPDPEIIVATSSFQAGISTDETKLFIQTGTGSAPASGGYTTSTTITFPIPFGALWNVIITVTTDRVTTGNTGWLPAQSVTGWTPGSAATNATANFTLSEDDPGPPCVFTSSVPFAWTAIGTIEVP